MRIAPILAVVIVLGSIGCATVPETFQASGAQLAAFDLQCAPEQLEVRTLSSSRQMGGGWDSAVVGVRGCGKQTTYAYTKAAKRWVRQSEITVIVSPAAAPTK